MLPRDSVHGALGGQHLWVPECDSIIWTPHQGMEQLWTGQDPRSHETPENLEKRWCCAAQSCIPWHLCVFGLQGVMAESWYFFDCFLGGHEFLPLGRGIFIPYWVCVAQPDILFVYYPIFGCQFRDACKDRTHLKQCTGFVLLWESHHRFSLSKIIYT